MYVAANEHLQAQRVVFKKGDVWMVTFSSTVSCAWSQLAGVPQIGFCAIYNIARDVLPYCCVAKDILNGLKGWLGDGRPSYISTRRFEQRTWKEHNTACRGLGASSAHR